MAKQYSSFGKIIAKLCVEKDLTHKDLSEYLNISQSHISNILTGKAPIALTYLNKLSDMFDLNEDERTQLKIAAYEQIKVLKLHITHCDYESATWLKSFVIEIEKQKNITKNKLMSILNKLVTSK